MSQFACHMSLVTSIMSIAYVDPWDMLNNFFSRVSSKVNYHKATDGSAKVIGAESSHSRQHLLHLLQQENSNTGERSTFLFIMYTIHSTF